MKGREMIETAKQMYIGSKIVGAWPQIKDGKEGYAVKYSDEYTSWSPKDVFEKAYLPLGFIPDPADLGGGMCPNNNRITLDMVYGFIDTDKTIVQKVGIKTTLVQVTLKNGFVITESSSCVDPANYNEVVGIECCMGLIKDKIWSHLGFLLQTAKYGVKPAASAEVGTCCPPSEHMQS